MLRSKADTLLKNHDVCGIVIAQIYVKVTVSNHTFMLKMLIKHSQVKDQLTMVIKQRDDFCKDFNQTFAKHAELKNNYEALRAEKDAAVKEYALVMSERDMVHKVSYFSIY